MLLCEVSFATKHEYRTLHGYMAGYGGGSGGISSGGT